MLADDRLEIDGITVDCLHSFDGTIYHVNSNSLVLNVDFGGYRILITGDITDGSLSKMLERIPEGDDRWKTDCVQIPHHGFGGFTDQLLRLTDPGLAFMDCTLPQYYDLSLIHILKTIATLFRDYKPYSFFTVIMLLCELIALIFFLPVLAEYIKTCLLYTSRCV